MKQTREYRSEYYKKNKQRILARCLRWQRNNPEKRALYRKRWIQKNRERVNILKRAYMSRRRGAIGKIDVESERKLYTLYPLCFYCRKNKADTIDHIQPASLGGTNEFQNLIPACRSCNSKKGARTLWKFAPMIAYMYERIR